MKQERMFLDNLNKKIDYFNVAKEKGYCIFNFSLK
jgi:hypothetical protein